MSVERLPLFPLHTVLFPGMVLPLHIFEERYKRMIRDCLLEGRDFGVALIREGVEVGGEAIPYEIGTTAHMTRVEHLDQGRMNIVAVGRRRFRLLKLHHDRPYLTADVEYVPLRGGNYRDAMALADRVRPQIGRYLELLAASVGFSIGVRDIPDDPIALAYMTAIALQMPEHEKQSLLSAEDLTALLSRERVILRRELALLRFILETEARQDNLILGATKHLYLN